MCFHRVHFFITSLCLFFPFFQFTDLLNRLAHFTDRLYQPYDYHTIIWFCRCSSHWIFLRCFFCFCVFFFCFDRCIFKMCSIAYPFFFVWIVFFNHAKISIIEYLIIIYNIFCRKKISTKILVEKTDWFMFDSYRMKFSKFKSSVQCALLTTISTDSSITFCMELHAAQCTAYSIIINP